MRAEGVPRPGDQTMPESLQSNRDALVEEIDAAFANVSRSGGVSWSETRVLDMYGSDDERNAARGQDTDRSWSELVDDPQWNATGIGGFSFLDPIGRRYYLPAAMIRTIRDEWNDDLSFHLTMQPNHAKPKHRLRPGNHFLEKWSLLDARQRRCVARFIRYMILCVEAGCGEDSDWREAYNSYWHLVDASSD